MWIPFGYMGDLGVEHGLTPLPLTCPCFLFKALPLPTALAPHWHFDRDIVDHFSSKGVAYHIMAPH